MNRTLDEHWQEKILNRVVAHCVDEKDGAGNIRLTDEAQCIIRHFLPDIINVVHTIKSDRMEPYIDAMHKNICSKCKFVRPDGSCELRARADCCLDRYYPLIVEVIEEVDAEKSLAGQVN